MTESLFVSERGTGKGRKRRGKGRVGWEVVEGEGVKGVKKSWLELDWRATREGAPVAG
ncbi:MAG: hypothetical protein OHK0021_07060 [Bryobacter sp.]